MSGAERWMPVRGWEGVYEVSDARRARRVAAGRGCRGVGRILAPRPSRRGYVRVRLGRRDASIHVLVLEAFVGPRPPLHEANHRNGHKADNRLSNLEWVTRSGNAQHAVDHGLRPPLRGAANGRTKLTADDVAAIRALRGMATQREIAARFGISKSRVGQIHAGG